MKWKEKWHFLSKGFFATLPIIFCVLSFTKKEREAKNYSCSSQQVSLGASPISDVDTNKYMQFFQNDINTQTKNEVSIIPSAVWVNKDVIKKIFDQNNVNGFYIYPMECSNDINTN